MSQTEIAIPPCRCKECAPDKFFDLLSVPQLAEILGVTTNTVHGLTRTRARQNYGSLIPHVRIGKRLYFPKAEVQEWIASRIVR